MSLLRICVICLVPALLLYSWPARSTVITVDSTSGGYEAGACTLLSAFASISQQASNGTCSPGSGDDQVILPANAHIVLTSVYTLEAGPAALPAVRSRVVIMGNGAHIASNVQECVQNYTYGFRFFTMFAPANLEIHDLELSGGCVTINSSGGEAGGGAILVYGGDLVLDDVQLSGNATDISGGAVKAGLNTHVTVVDSTLTNNEAGGTGAAIFTAGLLEIRSSYIGNNTSILGGNNAISAIYAQELKVLNSTFVDNRPAILSQGQTQLDFSTFLGNSVAIESTLGAISLNGNLFLQRPGGGRFSECDIDSNVVVTMVGNNVSDDSSCGTSVVTRSAARVGQIGAYGGHTPTVPLLAGSAAIDAVSGCTDVLGAAVAVDGRGAPRPQGSGCDAGAYEFSGVDEAAPLQLFLRAGDILVGSGSRIVDFSRDGNVVNSIWAPVDSPVIFSGIDVDGLSTIRASGANASWAALVGTYSTTTDAWTYIPEPVAFNQPGGSIAHWHDRWFVNSGSQSFYSGVGFLVYEHDAPVADLAMDMHVDDVSMGKDGLLYVLGFLGGANMSYAVRTFDPESLQLIREIPVFAGVGMGYGTSVAAAANGDIYVALMGPTIHRYSPAGLLLQQTDCVVAGNAMDCGSITNLRFSDDGILFVGGKTYPNGGRVTVLKPDFTSATSFSVPDFGISDVWLAPLPLDKIFTASFE